MSDSKQLLNLKRTQLLKDNGWDKTKWKSLKIPACNYNRCACHSHGKDSQVGKAFEFVVDYFSCIAAKRWKTETRSLQQGRTRTYKCWHLIMEEQKRKPFKC